MYVYHQTASVAFYKAVHLFVIFSLHRGHLATLVEAMNLKIHVLQKEWLHCAVVYGLDSNSRLNEGRQI